MCAPVEALAWPPGYPSHTPQPAAGEMMGAISSDMSFLTTTTTNSFGSLLESQRNHSATSVCVTATKRKLKEIKKRKRGDPCPPSGPQGVSSSPTRFLHPNESTDGAHLHRGDVPCGRQHRDAGDSEPQDRVGEGKISSVRTVSQCPCLTIGLRSGGIT